MIEEPTIQTDGSPVNHFGTVRIESVSCDKHVTSTQVIDSYKVSLVRKLPPLCVRCIQSGTKLRVVPT